MYVVGFAGPARVGKSAATSHLAQTARDKGWFVKILPFAGPLKREASERGFGKEDNPEEYRKFCQEYGAEMRAENENHWLERWMDDVKSARDSHREMDHLGPLLIIADDVRYENELKAITDGGGTTVFLHPGERLLPEADAEWRTHESEGLANTLIGNSDMIKEQFDYCMMNDKENHRIRTWASSFFNLIVNFPGSPEQVCTCEGCAAVLENRDANIDQLLSDLEDLVDGMDDDREDDE